MWSILQPHVIEPATVCARACNRLWSILQPHVALAQVEQPVAQLDGMMSDDDFAPVREQIRELRDEYAKKSSSPGMPHRARTPG